MFTRCTKKFLELLGKLFCDAFSASALCFRSDLLKDQVKFLDWSPNRWDSLDQWTQAFRLQNRREVPSVTYFSLVTIIFREEKFSAIFSFSYKKVFYFPNHFSRCREGGLICFSMLREEVQGFKVHQFFERGSSTKRKTISKISRRNPNYLQVLMKSFLYPESLLPPLAFSNHLFDLLPINFVNQFLFFR